MGKIKISISTIFIKIPLLLILVNVFCDSTIFAMRYRYSVIFIAANGVILALGMLCVKKTGYGRPICGIDILLIVMVLLVFMNNWNLKYTNYKYEVLFVILVLLFRFRNEFADIYLETLFLFLRYFGLLATATTLFFFLFPSMFSSFVLPKVPASYYANILYCFQHGYQSGIALHYSANGIFLVLYIGYLFSLVLQNNNKTKMNKVMIFIALFALFLTAKRAHIVFAIFAIYVTYYIWNSTKQRSRLFNSVGIVLLGLMCFIVLQQFVPQIGMFIQRFSEALSSDNVLGERSVLYSYAIDVFKQNPLLGSGWGSYKYLANSVLGQYNEAHNVFLQLLAETGMVGFVVCGLILILFIAVTIKKYKNSVINCTKSINKKEELAFCSYYMTFFGVYSLVGNPLYDTQLILLLMIVASVGMRKVKTRDVAGIHLGKAYQTNE